MTIAVWFDGDEALWDRRGFMLSGLVETPATGETSQARTPELFSDVLPTFVALTEWGSVGLIEYSDMPEGSDEVLPPFAHVVPGPSKPSDFLPSLHATESHLDWIPVLNDVATRSNDADVVVFVSNSLGAFELAAQEGWVTIWLNRDRVANLTDIEPDAEIHTLLDLPEALETMLEARAVAAGF